MVRYRPNHRSMARFLVSNQLAKPVMQVTRQIRRRAAAIAPKDSGELAESYRVSRGVAAHPTDNPTRRWPGGLRVVGYVTSTDDMAAAVEFGDRRTDEQRILRRAGARYHNPDADAGTVRSR